MSGASPCYICGSPITELALDHRDMKTKPCATCNTVIAETAGLGDEDDDFRAYIEDDDDFSDVIFKEFIVD